VVQIMPHKRKKISQSEVWSDILLYYELSFNQVSPIIAYAYLLKSDRYIELLQGGKAKEIKKAHSIYFLKFFLSPLVVLYCHFWH
jgi:hypothetical protein